MKDALSPTYNPKELLPVYDHFQSNRSTFIFTLPQYSSPIQLFTIRQPKVVILL